VIFNYPGFIDSRRGKRGIQGGANVLIIIEANGMFLADLPKYLSEPTAAI
jgi:hypothetical protein